MDVNSNVSLASRVSNGSNICPTLPFPLNMLDAGHVLFCLVTKTRELPLRLKPTHKFTRNCTYEHLWQYSLGDKKADNNNNNNNVYLNTIKITAELMWSCI